MKIGAGILRDKLRFERRSDVDEAHGGTDGEWFPMITVSARIKSLTGTEAVMEGRLNGVTAYELTVRSSSETAVIKQYWRAVNTRNGMTFNISAIVNPDERGKYLIMTAQSGVADG